PRSLCRGRRARARRAIRCGRDPPSRRALRTPAIRGRPHGADCRDDRMLNRHNRLLVAAHVLSDSALAVIAFLITYFLRFHTGLIPAPKGTPPLEQYINLLPFIAVLVPVGFQLQGLYRLRRGHSRVDDFFAVFVWSILAVVCGIVTTSYVEIYFATPAARDRGPFEVSQTAWAMFLVLNVALTFPALEDVAEGLG